MYLCTLHYTHFQQLAGKHAQNLNNCLFYSNCFPDLLTQSGLRLSVYQQKILIESQREKVSIPMSDELNTIIGLSEWMDSMDETIATSTILDLFLEH